jgi:hypothetical protein
MHILCKVVVRCSHTTVVLFLYTVTHAYRVWRRIVQGTPLTQATSTSFVDKLELLSTLLENDESPELVGRVHVLETTTALYQQRLEQQEATFQQLLAEQARKRILQKSVGVRSAAHVYLPAQLSEHQYQYTRGSAASTNRLQSVANIHLCLLHRHATRHQATLFQQKLDEGLAERKRKKVAAAAGVSAGEPSTPTPPPPPYDGNYPSPPTTDCFDGKDADLALHSCYGHGQCVADASPYDGVFVGCVCDVGYTGVRCEEQISTQATGVVLGYQTECWRSRFSVGIARLSA